MSPLRSWSTAAPQARGAERESQRQHFGHTARRARRLRAVLRALRGDPRAPCRGADHAADHAALCGSRAPQPLVRRGVGGWPPLLAGAAGAAGAGAAAARGPLRARLRPADIEPLRPLPLAGGRRGGVVWHRPRHLPPPRQPGPRPDAHGRAPAGAAGDGRHHPLPAAHARLAGCRCLGLRPAAALRAAGARRLAGAASKRWPAEATASWAPPAWTCRRGGGRQGGGAARAAHSRARAGHVSTSPAARTSRRSARSAPAAFASGERHGPVHLIRRRRLPDPRVFGPERPGV
jgi:hypothetical protein